MTTRHLLLPLAAISFFVPLSRIKAQVPTSPVPPGATPAAAVKVMHAARTSASINIDGKLNEAAWASAPPATDFTQSYPEVGGKPTDPTEVRILYDDDALYVGVRMFDSHPELIAAQLARRDAVGIYSDWLHVMVDSYHDR